MHQESDKNEKKEEKPNYFRVWDFIVFFVLAFLAVGSLVQLLSDLTIVLITNNSSQYSKILVSLVIFAIVVYGLVKWSKKIVAALRDRKERYKAVITILVTLLFVLFFVSQIVKNTIDSFKNTKEKAQISSESSTKKGNNQTTNAENFSNWQRMTSFDDDFSIKLPAGWEEYKDNKDAEVERLSYLGNTNKESTNYLIQRVDYTGLMKKNNVTSMNENDSRKLAKATMDDYLSTINGKVKDSQFTNFRDYPAIKFSAFEEKEDKKIIGVIFVNGNVAYALMGLSNNSEIPDFDNFVDSFSLK